VVSTTSTALRRWPREFLRITTGVIYRIEPAQ
jgi:hypothetical protein